MSHRQAPPKKCINRPQRKVQTAFGLPGPRTSRHAGIPVPSSHLTPGPPLTRGGAGMAQRIGSCPLGSALFWCNLQYPPSILLVVFDENSPYGNLKLLRTSWGVQCRLWRLWRRLCPCWFWLQRRKANFGGQVRGGVGSGEPKT